MISFSSRKRRSLGSNDQLTEIKREITVSGDLLDEQRAKLLEIADKCPVHRTLENEIKVRSRLADN